MGDKWHEMGDKFVALVGSGRQVYVIGILLNKFVALVGSGRQTCRPSRDKKVLKDWANGPSFLNRVTMIL
jgi:hypothetical protein